MKNLLVIIFIVFTAQINAQYSSITVEDFNKDGIDDELKCDYEIGSNFGGGNCRLTNGKSKTTFFLSNKACFCLIKKRIFVSPNLRKKENEYFLYSLKKEILPKFRSTPDQSLLWIIYAGLNSQSLKNHPHFDLLFNPQNPWRFEEPKLPYTYYIDMNAETISKITTEKSKLFNLNNAKNEKDYLLYFGDSHISTDSIPLVNFIPVSKNNHYEIFKTKHGVLVKKGKSYKWIFVTDKDLNASPQKLRWASIEEVVLQDEYVIIKQSLAPDSEFNIYIVNIETGIGGRLKLDFDFLLKKGIEIPDLKPKERFSIKDSSILIGKKRHKLKLSLIEIKQALEILAKRN